MQIFNTILVISVLVKACLGGSSSLCGSLKSNFVILTEASNIIIDYTVAFLTEISTESPVVSNGAANSLNCKIDHLKTLISEGTSRLSGSDSSYVSEILSGLVTPAFDGQLDCIEDGLIAMRDKLSIANTENADNIRNHFVAANVSSDATCSSLQSIVTEKYDLFSSRIGERILAYSNINSFFKNLNILDLYQNFLVAQISCDSGAIAVSIANIINGDENEAFGYSQNLSSELSYPLDCVQDLIEESGRQIDSWYNEVIDTVQNA